jgi:hypothetical protein
MQYWRSFSQQFDKGQSAKEAPPELSNRVVEGNLFKWIMKAQR